MELRVGLMKNIESYDYGSPYDVLGNITAAKESGLDVLIGPEWSLNSAPGVYSKSLLEGKNAKKTVESIFNAPDYSEYAPRDAKRILEKQIESGVKKFDRVPYIPYSEREYNKLVDDLKKKSRGSDMLIIPGTAVFYDSSNRMYNALPVIRAGNLVRTFYKFRDGLTSRFNLNGGLKMYPVESEDAGIKGVFKSYGTDPKLDFNGLSVGVEICADAGLLTENYKITDLDMQVLSSCGNSTTVRATNHNGYVLVADGYRNPEVRVSSWDSNKLRPVSDSGSIATFALEFGNE